MRIPIAWLREFADLPDGSDAIADRLAMLGFPVAQLERRPTISGVIAGRVRTLEKHPNADRLHIGEIDVGRDRPLTIVTAATNVAAGQHIAVATIGARLPALAIEGRTMRGVASEGMMISAQELALPPEWFEDGILQFDASLAPGTDVVEYFGLNLDVLDVEVTTNRVDAMCAIGLARELAASYGVPLRLPSQENPANAREPRDERIEISIESRGCTRFVAQRFDDVNVGVAPTWLRIRLALAGQRPINNVVDVSNYVMFETGQPLHVYDTARISGSALYVRDAKTGENVVTLDGVERTLSSQSLVIADRERILCLAGLMGAQAGEVSATTTSILVEAANFEGARVRRMSNELGLRSEASSRHEKALAPALTDFGASRAAQILTALGAKGYKPRAYGSDIDVAAPITLKARDVERIIGLAVPRKRIARDLEVLGCGVKSAGSGTLSVTPPVWRRDLTLPVDLVEEVARVEGYDAIPEAMPDVPAHAISSAQYDLENEVARVLAGLGYCEIVTHTLESNGKEQLEIRNPLSEEHRFLRQSLVPGFIGYAAAHDTPLRMFEIGHVFASEDGAIVESPAMVFGFSADGRDEPAWRDSHFLRLKGDCEALVWAVTGRTVEAARGEREGFHPGKSARLVIGGRDAGTLGALDPRLARHAGLEHMLYLCTMTLGPLAEYVVPRYRAPSKFPSTYRDLALVVGLSVTAAELEAAVAEALGPISTRVRAFDEYRGPQVGDGRKSIAVRITLQRFDTTITDEEADTAVASALEALRARFGATVRA